MLRTLAAVGPVTIGFALAIPLVKGMKSKARKTQLKSAGPLFGITIASYYLSTSLDYFVSQHYFGKILSTVKIDEDLYNVIKDESQLDYKVLTNFCYR